jgi:hypothetical protein
MQITTRPPCVKRDNHQILAPHLRFSLTGYSDFAFPAYYGGSIKQISDTRWTHLFPFQLSTNPNVVDLDTAWLDATDLDRASLRSCFLANLALGDGIALGDFLGS